MSIVTRSCAPRPVADRHLRLVQGGAAQARRVGTALPLERRPAGVSAISAPPHASLRLTRRGLLLARLLVGLVALALVTVVLFALARPAAAGDEKADVQLEYRTVLPGETLWQIAQEEAPGVDPRDTIARIVRLNHLSSSGVAAGQRIALPPTP